MTDEITALAIFAGALAAIVTALIFRAAVRAGRRRAAARDLARGAFGEEGGAVIETTEITPAVPAGPVLVAMRGKKAAIASASSGGPPASAEDVAGAALYQDEAGRTGLKLDVGGRSFVVSALPDMLRAYAELARAGVAVELALDPAAVAARRDALLAKLHAKEAETVKSWLVQGEAVFAAGMPVGYEGRVPSQGSRGSASLVVTNLRLGLLAQTVTVERRGNVSRTTTFYNLLGYALPLAAALKATRAPALRQDAYRIDFTWLEGKGPKPENEPPALLLGPEHGAALLPIALTRRPVEVREAAIPASRLVGPLVKGGIGFAILGGGLAGGAFALAWNLPELSRALTGEGTRWMESWIPFVIAGGALAGALLRGLSTFEAFFRTKR
jgi:hypothetical protein